MASHSLYRVRVCVCLIMCVLIWRILYNNVCSPTLYPPTLYSPPNQNATLRKPNLYHRPTTSTLSLCVPTFSAAFRPNVSKELLIQCSPFGVSNSLCTRILTSKCVSVCVCVCMRVCTRSKYLELCLLIMIMYLILSTLLVW